MKCTAADFLFSTTKLTSSIVAVVLASSVVVGVVLQLTATSKSSSSFQMLRLSNPCRTSATVGTSPHEILWPSSLTTVGNALLICYRQEAVYIK